MLVGLAILLVPMGNGKWAAGGGLVVLNVDR